jgi:hypothetical protein
MLCGYTGARHAWVKRTIYFNFFLFLRILREENFIFVKLSIFRPDIAKNIKYCFVAFYTHNIHEWYKFLCCMLRREFGQN